MQLKQVNIFWFLLISFMLFNILPAFAQPFPPINLAVLSRAADNQLSWAHHPLNPAGYVVNYQICRGTTYGATVAIATVTATTISFYDNRPGYSYDQEFYYTVRAVGNDTLVSQDSEQVMRFLPRVGLTGIGLQNSTIQEVNSVSWEPYPGQWTDTYIRLKNNPNPGAGVYTSVDYGQRQITRADRTYTLPVGGPYYFEVMIGAPDWWGSPANRRWVSTSTSLPFYVDPVVYEDNASSTYFNSSPSRVMADPLAAGGVAIKNFSNSSGNFWRIREPVRRRGQVEYLRIPTIYLSKLNAPLRTTISGIPAGQLAAGRAAAEVRVANEYGDELVSQVVAETISGGWVTGFTVHFLASQDYNVYENYWIYWGNPSATAPNYGAASFKNSTNKTAQFDYSLWYSRIILRGGVETYVTTPASRLLASSLPTEDTFVNVQPLKNGATVYDLPFFDYTTNNLNVSTNGYLSFAGHSLPLNNWAAFTGAGGDRFIAPFWGNLMINDSQPGSAGLYFQGVETSVARRHHGQFTWIANRENAGNEAYIFQANLYRFGDISLRYQTLNYNGLFQTPSVAGDNPLNIAPHHTAGISANDGTRWLSITDDSLSPTTENAQVTPLMPDTGRNVIHHFQSCHSWESPAFADPTNLCSMAGPTSVAHYDSRIFDGRSTDPTWTNIEYQVAGTGQIDLYVRTSASTGFPAWNATHLKASGLGAGAGAINLTLPNDRYLQYRAVFKKSVLADNPVLRRIKLNVGYVIIDNTTNEYNAVDVSQGQTFLASMTYSNFYSNPVNTIAASLTFAPATAMQTWIPIDALPSGVAPNASTTIGYQVTVDENSGNLDTWTYIDGYLEAGDGIATLTSTSALSRSYYRIRRKADLVISWVDTPFDKVNKGQGGIPVQMLLTNNAPQVPLIVNDTVLNFSLGQYTIDPEFTINPADQGLFGVYYNTVTTNPPPFPQQGDFSRVDSVVNFNWAAASPVPGIIGTDYFAVRWSGYVIPTFTEPYIFYPFTDDGTRLWVNGQLVVDNWVNSTSERVSKTVNLVAGVPVEIILEMYDRISNSRAELRWESPSTLKNIIPASQLRPAYIPVIHGGQSLLVNYTVAVQPNSPSGVVYINGTASGTNAWVPGLRTEANSALIIDSWVIQAPAELAIGQIKVPPLVYRGQANVPVEVEILNIGEADAEVASIPLSFTLGSYAEIIPGETMPVTVTGGESRFIKVLVSILEDTATGTSWIDAEVSGNDANTGAAISATGAAIPGEWTILAEKILTYKDPSFLYPSTAFVKPAFGQTGVYALAENLVALKEYAIRWYDASDNEITSATTIGFSDPSGTLAAEWRILPSFDYGVYTVKITNPVNTYSPSQTSFRIVTSASASALLMLPEKVSIGQTFTGNLEITNLGGADATGMVPTSLVTTGPGTANLLSGPTPASLEVPGGTTATITYNFNATGQGNFMLAAGANGFDASSDATIAAASVDSNICLIQTPALTSIVGLTATPTIVYRDQRGIEVLMTLANTGQADALISLADLRLPPNNNLTLITSALASPTLPFILSGNSMATFTFRININATAAAGPTSVLGRIQYRDANNPVTLYTVINQTYTFTIQTPVLQCYADNTFVTARYAYNDGATVYARASGLPTNTDVKIRFYENTEPFPPTGPGVAVVTPLNTGATGIVSHPGHTIPSGTDKRNQWLVIVDDGNDFNVGNILAMQFFDVYSLGSYSVNLTFATDRCFVGDTLNASLVVNNLATWPTNVRHNLNAFNQTYAPDSIGRFNRVSWSGGTFPFPAGASYTFNAVLLADIDSGTNGSTTLRLPVNQWRVLDDSQGGATIWYGIVDAASPVTIYRKGLQLQLLPQVSAITGLRGEYYNTVVAPTPMPTGDAPFTRVDDTVGFDWVAGSPAPGVINTDYFAARWSGYVTPQHSQTYTFYTKTDSGVRLWVNGVKLVERWIITGATEVNGVIALTAGTPVPIVMEYFENNGNAMAELRWQSPSTPKAIIPSTNLSHTPYLPPIWDFGVVNPGSTSLELQSQLTNTGNHQLENVKLAKVDLRKSAAETISGAYLQTNPPMPLELATGSEMTIFSSIQIPFHQAPGVYVATMAIYEDHNDSNTLEVTDLGKEPHNLVMARVEVKADARAMMVNDSIYLGIIGQGQTSPEQPLEFVGTGNQNLTNLKFDDLSAQGVTITPLNPGLLVFDGYGTASISVTIPAAQPPGVYFATGTLRDDIPGGATDQFLIKWEVGTQSLMLNSHFFGLGTGTPTYQLPVYPLTIINTGELPLNRLKGIATNFKNIQQPGAVASDNISLTSPSVIQVLQTKPSSAAVYVPGGTATGTYVATFTWFEDINSNSGLDSFEARDTSIASFVVQSYYRLYSLKSTEDFGGVKPDTTKVISIGIRNAGSLVIPRIKFVVNSMTNAFNVFDAANIAVPASVNNMVAGELRYFDMGAYVPLLQAHGVYSSTMTIYGDINDDGSYDPLNEPACEVLLRIEIGAQELSITTPIEVLLSGTAASTSSSIFVTAKNTGSLALTRVRAQGTNLIPQVAGPSIASTAIQFLPASLVGSLVANQSRSFSTRVAVPFAQPSGIYEGTIWTWEDANNDGLRQTEETAASVPVKLTVTYVKTLQTSPGALNFGQVARGDTATASFVAQNIGNTSLIDARWEKGILTGLTPIIAANFTISPDPVGFMATPPVGLPVNEVSTLTLFIPTGTADGAYSGAMIFFEDDTNPAANVYDTGIEPFFALPVILQVATPFISVTDPITIPASNPTGQTASAAFTVSNTGSIAFKNLNYSLQNLVSGTNQIMATNLKILPAALNALTPGQTQNAEISAWLYPPTSVLPGIYTGTLTIYDDRNFNGIRDGHESYTNTVVSLTVKAYPALNILPVNLNAGKIARNTFSNPLNIEFQNTGNIPLTGLTWNKDNLFKNPGVFIPTASMAFMQPEPVAVNAIATAQLVIGRIAPDQELGGPYGPAEQFLEAGSAVDSFFVECEIIPGGPQGLDKGSVWQEVVTATFPVMPATGYYILSAYVSPGSGSAKIGFLLTDAVGIKKDFYGGSIDDAGLFTPDNAVGGIVDTLRQDTGLGYDLPWYRVFIKFQYGFSDAIASKTYILLQNTGIEGVGHSAWFDGIQLEKVDQKMTGPTSWSKGKKLYSPSSEKDLSGRKGYNQW